MSAFASMGCTCYQMSGLPGFPDLVVISPRQSDGPAGIFLVECKSRKGQNQLTPDQKDFHMDAFAGQWPVYIASSQDDALDILNRFRRSYVKETL